VQNSKKTSKSRKHQHISSITADHSPENHQSSRTVSNHQQNKSKQLLPIKVPTPTTIRILKKKNGIAHHHMAPLHRCYRKVVNS
jgi:hypothetical protein